MLSALNGLKVVELGHVIAIPFAAAMLADFGAEVIKVEVPNVGDGLRYSSRIKNMFFAIEGRNKKCITLNLQKEEGKEILRKLLHDADVVMENYRPGTLDKLGFSWEELQKINPRLSLVSISGFGQTGPYKYRPGYDSVGMAMGGLTYVSGSPEQPPARPGVAIGDYVTGLFAALGAMFAIYARDNGGLDIGQRIDASLYESIFRITETATIEYSYDKKIKERVGNGHPSTVPSGHFQTKDGKWVVISSGNDKIFGNVCRCIKRLDWLADERFKTQVDRIANRKEIDETVKGFVLAHTAKELLEIFGQDVPVALIYSIEDIFKDPQYAARENIVEVDTENFGKIMMQGIMPKLSVTPGAVKWAGVGELGYHNEEIYGKLGFGTAELKRMKDLGVI